MVSLSWIEIHLQVFHPLDQHDSQGCNFIRHKHAISILILDNNAAVASFAECMFVPLQRNHAQLNFAKTIMMSTKKMVFTVYVTKKQPQMIFIIEKFYYNKGLQEVVTSAHFVKINTI